MREKERKSVCVCVRERGGAREIVCVCVHLCEDVPFWLAGLKSGTEKTRTHSALCVANACRGHRCSQA